MNRVDLLKSVVIQRHLLSYRPRNVDAKERLEIYVIHAMNKRRMNESPGLAAVADSVCFFKRIPCEKSHCDMRFGSS
jgi:hypothetical protein